MLECALTDQKFHLCHQLETELGDLLQLLRLLLISLVGLEIKLASSAMRNCLLVDTRELHGFLAECVGSLTVLFVDLLQGLLVVALCDLPGDATAEVSVQRVHSNEDLLEIARLVCTRLTCQQEGQPRVVDRP